MPEILQGWWQFIFQFRRNLKMRFLIKGSQNHGMKKVTRETTQYQSYLELVDHSSKKRYFDYGHYTVYKNNNLLFWYAVRYDESKHDGI